MYKLNRLSKIALALIVLSAILIAGVRARIMNIQSQATPTQPGQEDASNFDAETYAKNYGISLDEALHRFRLQDAARELQSRLQENEADTFAAIWLEHTPEFKIVVLFTHDAEQKIKPYLTDELVDVVEARNVDESLAMLEDAQKEIISSLLELGIHVESEVDVYENRITIFVNETDRNQLDTALKDKQIVLPNNVDIVTVWKLEQTGEAANPPSLGDHFPQLTNPPGGYDLGMAGDLVLENGCLRLSGIKDMEDSFLLIWDARFTTRTEQGVVHVIDSLTSKILASAGDYVMVGYAGDFVGRTLKPIPEECLGPYMVVGESIENFERPSLGSHFPQSIAIQGGDLETSLQGDLELENGCLRIKNTVGAPDGNDFLLIWDLRFSTHTKQAGVQVIDSRTGKIQISEGDFAAVDGRVIESPSWVWLKESVPDECLGPYFQIGFGESIKKIDKP